MMEYSAKQCVWDGLPDDDTILLQYPNDNNTQGSFGLTSIGSDINQDSNTMLHMNHTVSQTASLDDGIIESDHIIESSNIILTDNII